MGRVAKDAKDDPENSTVHRTYSEQKGFGFIRSDGGGVDHWIIGLGNNIKLLKITIHVYPLVNKHRP